MTCGTRCDMTHNLVAKRLWLAHGVEIGVYALALWLLNVTLWASLGMVAIIALGWRTLLTLLAWALARRFGGSRWRRRRLGPADTLRLVAGETLASFVLYSALQPLEPWLMRGSRRPAKSDPGPAVILIHGFMCNGAVWWPLRRRLLAAGIERVHTVNVQPDYANMRRDLNQLREALSLLRRNDGDRAWILVGHSMGGLLARMLAFETPAGEALPARIITIGSPHRGTRHSGLLGLGGRGPAPPDAHWLAALDADGDTGAGVPVTSIFSTHDTLVSPASSAVLKEADNIELDGLGHLELLFSRRCHAAVLAAIRQVGASEPAC